MADGVLGRADARGEEIESEIDKKLVSYSKLSASTAKSANQDDPPDPESGDGIPLLAPDDMEKVADTMAKELDTLFQQLSTSIEGLNACGNESGNSATMLHTVQRHREIFHDYATEFKKTRSNLIAQREQAELLSSVRRDIKSYRNGTGPSSRQDALLRERGAIHGSERAADSVLGQALLTSEALAAQRRMFSGISGRMYQMRARFPAINTLVNNIQRRKLRDKLILGAVIGICLCILIW
eukprot:CAMPEP_0175979336 /NCGR_PEP_ID=MMETSP0108-20121206/46169_1 /TAXON_ID=195067 ORGANISM="Goniomonas pacifica, Strain CCMP1869" /NCGR_SAMPLE_ID=MMETSP0108 /ASSEMBLY_ACC=CAM_ASM_000204 /LENGTH=239 /DNA_ID=CAMNT_0017309635 /DNA_START=11 /DNA_END=728 /DNA_ORIENTATION=+